MITNKSLFVAFSWSHLYLLIKDARSFEQKSMYTGLHVKYGDFSPTLYIGLHVKYGVFSPTLYIGLHVKYPSFLSNFHEIFNFLDSFSKNNKISNFMTIRPVTAELFRAYGWTDRQT